MSSRSLEPRSLGYRLGRASALLLAFCGLSACVAQPTASGYGRPPLVGGTAFTAPVGRRVAVLVPLSGANAQLGRSMLLAARLAFQPGPADAFDTQDTKSTPEGAVAAANAAVIAGAGLIVGPLTAAETSAVAPLAKARNVPMLALTSDSSRAQPGVWPLGLTPAQQVRTLVRASMLDDKRRIAAILPVNPFGDALATGLTAATTEAGLPPANILRYQSAGQLDAAIKQLAISGGAPGVPPALDALLLGTPTDATLAMLPALVAADLGPDRIRILGTALWARDTTRLAPLAGAWFAGPPATTLKVFEDNYIAKYGTPPRDVASIAFDAAGAARASIAAAGGPGGPGGPGGIDVGTLLNPSGFAGANGVFRLLPDGTVRRRLAIFEIGSVGIRLREPPPEAAALPSM